MGFIKKFLADDRVWITGLAGLFTGLYSLYGIVRHYRFESWGFDLGIFDQALWLYSRFRLPFSTIKFPNTIILGDHFSPSFALLSPAYWILADVRLLIFLQALLFCLGSVAIYLLAKSVLNQKFLALTVALCYLAFWGSQYALTFDVHMITFGAAVLPWLFYCLHFRRWFSYWLLFIFALGFKEDMSIILFSLGIYAFLQYRYRKVAIVSVVVSFLWFLLTTRVLIPALAGSFVYASVFPRNINEIINVLVVPVEKWKAVFWSFFSFAFIPLNSWSTLPMVTLHFFVHWLDPRFFGRWEMPLHYRIPLASMLAVALIWGIKNFGKRIPPGITGLALLTALLVSQLYLHLPLNTLLKPAYYQREARFTGLDKLVAKIPPEASVITQNNIAPHLSRRARIYLTLPKEKKCDDGKYCDWLATDDADYILLDLTDGQSPNNFWGYSLPGVKKALDNMVKTGTYSLADRQDNMYLYRRVL